MKMDTTICYKVTVAFMNARVENYTFLLNTAFALIFHFKHVLYIIFNNHKLIKLTIYKIRVT